MSEGQGGDGPADLGDDFKIIRGEPHKGTGHEGGSARPLVKPKAFDPAEVIRSWPVDKGTGKQKQKPSAN